MAKKDNRRGGNEAPRATRSVEVPDELKQFLIAASRPPQKVSTSTDARSDVLISFAQVLGQIAVTIESLGQQVVAAPNYSTLETRE